MPGFLGFQTMGILVSYCITCDAVGVFGLAFHLLFKSCSNVLLLGIVRTTYSPTYLRTFSLNKEWKIAIFWTNPPPLFPYVIYKCSLIRKFCDLQKTQAVPYIHGFEHKLCESLNRPASDTYEIDQSKAWIGGIPNIKITRYVSRISPINIRKFHAFLGIGEYSSEKVHTL